MRNEIKVGSLVSLRWLDTTGTDKEHTKIEALALEPLIFTTYGIFLGQTKTKTTIACTQGMDDQQPIFRDVIAFPVEVVKKIEQIKEVI